MSRSAMSSHSTDAEDGRSWQEGGRSILMLSTHGYVSAEPELGKPDTGGQVVFVLELAKCLARSGHSVDVVTRRFGSQAAVEEVGDGVRLLRVPFGGSEFIRKEDMHDHIDEMARNFLAMVETDSLRYDLVSSHYWDAGWAGQRIADALDVPHVHTPHSLGAWKRQEMEGARRDIEATYRFDERIAKESAIYRECSRVIATTSQQLEVLESEYDISGDRVSVIPPGLDERRYTPVDADGVAALRQRFECRATDVYTVGRAATNKGIDLLIRSLPQLRRLVPDARLQLAVGAGSKRDRDRVESWKTLSRELGVADAISWIGYVPDDEMADRYRAAGIFALPSRYEPFGMTAIEAMACGAPSVLTVHGGLHELIDFGCHALMGDPECPDEFGVLLALPMRYPALRQKLAREGADHARSHFGWSGVARRTLAVFDRVEHELPCLAADR